MRACRAASGDATRCSPAVKPFSGCRASVAAAPTCRDPEPGRCGWMLPTTEMLKLARVVFDEHTIRRRVQELGQEITAAYPSGDLRLLYDPATQLEGRHILLVEDIVDTGKTINRLVELLRKRRPESLEICALLHKHVAPRLALEPRFVGFDAPPAFLVGYGLDHAENFRHLPYIASLT